MFFWMGGQGIEICLDNPTAFSRRVKPSSLRQPFFGGSFHQPAFGIPFESLRLRRTWRSLQDFPETAGGWENTKRLKKKRFTLFNTSRGWFIWWGNTFPKSMV